MDLVDHPVEQLELRAAGAGDRHDVAPPVTGVDGAFDESALLQLVEHGHDVAAVNARAAREVSLADRTPFLERGEETVVVAAKSGTAGCESVVEQRVRAGVVAADEFVPAGLPRRPAALTAGRHQRPTEPDRAAAPGDHLLDRHGDDRGRAHPCARHLNVKSISRDPAPGLRVSGRERR